MIYAEFHYRYCFLVLHFGDVIECYLCNSVVIYPAEILVSICFIILFKKFPCIAKMFVTLLISLLQNISTLCILCSLQKFHFYYSNAAFIFSCQYPCFTIRKEYQYCHVIVELHQCLFPCFLFKGSNNYTAYSNIFYYILCPYSYTCPFHSSRYNFREIWILIKKEQKTKNWLNKV